MTYHSQSEDPHSPSIALLFTAALFCFALVGCTLAPALDFGDAPDPSYPTEPDDPDAPGPGLTALDDSDDFLAAIILGDCVTTETGPQFPDDCDDSLPQLHLTAQEALVRIRRTGIAEQGTYWINLLVDADDSGDWYRARHGGRASETGRWTLFVIPDWYGSVIAGRSLDTEPGHRALSRPAGIRFRPAPPPQQSRIVDSNLPLDHASQLTKTDRSMAKPPLHIK